MNQVLTKRVKQVDICQQIKSKISTLFLSRSGMKAWKWTAYPKYQDADKEILHAMLYVIEIFK